VGSFVRRRRGWFGRGVRGLGLGVLAAVFWAGVVFVQRPWQALARAVAGVPPPAPALGAEPPRPEWIYDDFVREQYALQGIHGLAPHLAEIARLADKTCTFFIRPPARSAVGTGRGGRCR